MKNRTLFFLLALALPVLSSQAIAGSNIYKHVDKDGNITFTNRAVPNAEKISIASFSRNTGNAPRVKDTTQKERDAVRRQILQKELTAEERLFADTQIFLDQIGNNSESGGYQDKLVQLKNKLFLHQRNITALKKELARL